MSDETIGMFGRFESAAREYLKTKDARREVHNRTLDIDENGKAAIAAWAAQSQLVALGLKIDKFEKWVPEDGDVEKAARLRRGTLLMYITHPDYR